MSIIEFVSKIIYPILALYYKSIEIGEIMCLVPLTVLSRIFFSHYILKITLYKHHIISLLIYIFNRIFLQDYIGF